MSYFVADSTNRNPERTLRNLKRAFEIFEYDDLNIRDKFTHGELNFTSTTLLMDGDPVLEVSSTGGGLPRVVGIDGGKEKVEDWMDENLEDAGSVMHFFNMFTDYYALENGLADSSDTLMIKRK